MLGVVIQGRFLNWLLPLLSGVVSAAVLAVGFYLAVTGRFGDRLGPSPPAAVERGWGEGALRVVALGDSVSFGTGDEPERGYVRRVVEELRETGRSVALTNLAEPGAETGDLLGLLAEASTAQRLATAHLILLSIGGNDLNHGLREASERPLEPGEMGASTRAPSDEQIPDSKEALASAGENFRAIVVRLREINPSATVRILGIYNPFEVIPSAETMIRKRLFDWNAAIARATHPYKDVVMVPISDLFLDRPDRLAGDKFHPGPDGHDEIADRVFATLKQDD